MSTYQAGVVGFFISVFVFYLIAIQLGGKPANLKQFFHDRNVSLNVFSLAAGNLALAQGIVFVLMGTRQFGFLYLLVPGVVFLAQFVVYPKLITWVNEDLYLRGTVLAGISDAMDIVAGKPVRFQMFTTIYIVLTFLFGLCYEIFVSSNWLAAAMFPDQTVAGKGVIAFVILALTLSYVITGGYRTVQRTDCIQVIFGTTLIIGILVILLSNGPAAPQSKSSPLLPTGVSLWVAFLTMLIAPFATQIYSILNHALASHQQNVKERKRLFKVAGLVIFFIYIALAIVALYYNHTQGDALDELNAWLSSSTKSYAFQNVFLVMFATIGMGAIIMSTVDTMMITVAQVSFEGFVKGNSKSEETKDRQLRNIRTVIPGVFVPVFAILAWWWYVKPDSFNLLFAVASPCQAIAPMIVCLLWLSKRGKVSAILRPVIGNIRYVDLYYMLFFLTLVGAFVALATNWKWSLSVGFFAFLISSFVSFIIFIQQKSLTTIS